MPASFALGGLVLLAACLLEFLVEVVNELVVLGTFLLCPGEFGLHGRELGLSLLEEKLKFMTGLLALGALVLPAAYLLEFLLELLNELVVLGTFLLCPREFGLHGRELGLLLLEGESEFMAGLFAVGGFV